MVIRKQAVESPQKEALHDTGESGEEEQTKPREEVQTKKTAGGGAEHGWERRLTVSVQSTWEDPALQA